MKNTKKLSITMMLCLLVLSLVMYNCSKKDEPLPSDPDPAIVKEFDDIKIEPVAVTPPAAVAVTESSVEASAKAAEVNGALGSIASSGTVPASVSAAADEVNAALSTEDIAVLNSVTPATLEAVKAGGEIPAEVKAALDKAMANPALQAYLPKFTFPTVGGQVINGRSARTAAPGGIATSADASESIEAIQEASDACIAAADAAYAPVKTRLDASKATNDAAITAAYAAAIAGIPAEQTACTGGLDAKYAPLFASVDTQIAQALADLAAGREVLGALYAPFEALIKVQALGAYSGLNSLKAADAIACTSIGTAKTAAAAAARDADLAASNVTYTTALAAANVVRTRAIQSCHNQGGGN